MAHRISIATLIATAALAGCSDDAEIPDAGPRDAEVIDVGARNPGSPDAGTSDIAVRSLVNHDLIPASDRGNRVLLPDFESRLINGSWLALPVTGGQPVPWMLRHLHNRPGQRPEAAVIEPSTNFVGFGMSSDVLLGASVWLGSPSVNPAWATIESGLIGYIDGMGSGVVELTNDRSTEQRIDGVFWRRFTVDNVQDFVGRITFLVQNRSREPVLVNAPFIGERSSFTSTPRAKVEPLPPTWRLVPVGMIPETSDVGRYGEHLAQHQFPVLPFR